jgi:D-serine deaminase-like pyridoxal phosphate-dependent protein
VKVEEINTPALLVDLDAMEFNLHRMAGFFAETPAKLRPHFKNHKSPMLARKQIRAGAIGMTCATLREAEILVHHGVESILIANEVAGDAKARQIAELSRYSSVIVAVDSVSGVNDLARAQRNHGVQLEVVVDVDLGLDRCGVPPGEAAVDLTRSVVEQGLAFRGLMGYDGHLQALPANEQQEQLAREGSKALLSTAERIRSLGIPVTIISTGGTGTYGISGVYPGITEIQAGSYLLMDDLYVDRGSRFQPSLTVLTTVISKRGSKAVIDCGVKAISAERGLSQVKALDGIRLRALHAEHGLLEIDEKLSRPLEIGQRIELWVRYSDATMNLHTFLHGVRHGQVEETFRIEH